MSKNLKNRPKKPAKKSVWLITSGEYSDYGIEGIFSTEENAKLAYELLKSNDRYDSIHEPREWILDGDLDKVKQGKKLYRVSMKLNGDVISVNLSITISEKEMFRENSNFNIENYFYGVCWAKDEKHAIKIVNEKRIQYLAQPRRNHA